MATPFSSTTTKPPPITTTSSSSSPQHFHSPSSSLMMLPTTPKPPSTTTPSPNHSHTSSHHNSPSPPTTTISSPQHHHSKYLNTPPTITTIPSPEHHHSKYLNTPTTITTIPSPEHHLSNHLNIPSATTTPSPQHLHNIPKTTTPITSPQHHQSLPIPTTTFPPHLINNASHPTPLPPPNAHLPIAPKSGDNLHRSVHTPSDRLSRSVSDIVRRSDQRLELRKAGVALRFAAAVLSLISFSVMAADKTKGWAGDSYDRYREYRYCITVNILTFIYSSFQIYAQLHEIMKGKLVFRPQVSYYFDLFFDQILAYLLISASSAASTRNYDWIVSWGSDPFTVMINGSVSMSYLAFAALAISSLISAHNLFSRLA